MQIYSNTASILAAVVTHPDPELRHLLTERIKSLAEDLTCLLHVLVLEPGDTATELDGQSVLARFSLAVTGFRLPDFCPPWELIEAHCHWFELTFVLGDDGAGMLVFVPMSTADTELLAMCKQYAQ